MFMCVYVCVCINVPVRDSVFRQASSCLFASSPFHPFISIFPLVFLNCVSWLSMISQFFYLIRITKESNFLFITPSSSGNFRSKVYQFFCAQVKQFYYYNKTNLQILVFGDMVLCFPVSVFVASKESTALISRVARDLNFSYFFTSRLLELMQLLFKNVVSKSLRTHFIAIINIGWGGAFILRII